jgi:hypothetical protein
VPFHQGGAQSPGGGVEGDPGAGDASPDHEDVEGLRGQAAQGVGPVERSRHRRWRPRSRRQPGGEPDRSAASGQPATGCPEPVGWAGRPRGSSTTIVNKQSLVIRSAERHEIPRGADAVVPGPRPEGDGPAAVHLPGPPGRRDPSDGRVGPRRGPGRGGDDLVEDRVPDPERVGRPGRDRRPRPGHRDDEVRSQRRAAAPSPRVPVVREGAGPPRRLHRHQRARPAPTRASRWARPRSCSAAGAPVPGRSGADGGVAGGGFS